MDHIYACSEENHELCLEAYVGLNFEVYPTAGWLPGIKQYLQLFPVLVLIAVLALTELLNKW